MSRPPDSQSPQSPKDFALHLRHRAAQAAEASVQHAGLSERYLELSWQLAALAEKAATSSVPELQTALTSLEARLQNAGAASVVRTAAAIDSGQGTVPDLPTGAPATVGDIAATAESAPDESETTASNTEATSPSDQPASTPSIPSLDSPPSESDSETAESETAEEPGPASAVDAADTAEGVSVPEVPAKRPRPRRSRTLRSRTLRSRTLRTRTFVERVRSVRLAVARRVRVDASQEDLKPQQRRALDELRNSRGSIATSVVIVVIALFLLSLITLQLHVDVPMTPIMASFADEIAEIEEPLPVEIPEEEQGEQQEEETEEPVEEPVEEPEPEEPPEELMEEPDPDPQPAEEEADAAEPEVETGEIAAVDNRSTAGRQQMLEKFGGSAASESAVQRGLEWLASVQTPQGWWDFPVVGDAGSPGRVNNPIGATAYALMPFLAAGQTHQEGSYQKQVRAGLDYLCSVGVNAPAGYDLRGVLNKGNEDEEPNEAYYVHGAATLVLCEAWGMTKDRRLRRPAEGALRFLLNSQDPRGGGWRYLPQQPGSTSVTAIQVMALMAARNAQLKVPDKTLQGVMHYLDSVQVDGEGRYGYEAEKKTYKGSITAMALLCRMYLGWGRDDGDMRAGVALLDKAGPYDNLYTTYFATQVMRNWGGDEWTRWNERMQQNLIGTQVTEGPGTGSWKPRSGMHTKQGGRLLETALATLTLEVYYRYKPVLPEPVAAEQPVVSD